jgi:hypothetical protein
MGSCEAGDTVVSSGGAGRKSEGSSMCNHIEYALHNHLKGGFFAGGETFVNKVVLI